MRFIKLHFFYTIFFATLILSSCVLPAQSTNDQLPFTTRYSGWQQTLTPDQNSAEKPGMIQTQLPIIQDTPKLTDAPSQDTTQVFLHPGLPQKVISELELPLNSLSDAPENANLRFLLGESDQKQADLPSTSWVYALVAPFYTLSDGLTMDSLAELWSGQPVEDLAITQILVTEETYAVFQELFGEPDEERVKFITKEDLNALALSDQPFLSLLPFEELTPHWKILRVDGQSPIDSSFSQDTYPLSLQIWMEGTLPSQTIVLPSANYDPGLRTVLIMTGVTALTRATAHRMALQGNHYPGMDIQPWFLSADLVHISNEVAFAENCPPPDPVQPDLIFCSSPERIELLEFVSADIIELSGNHMLDYGVQAMNLTLEMYAERNWATYAGGENLTDARSPALISHNGNQLAFLGCNPVGPPNSWATNTQPGSAPCGDYQWLLDELHTLRVNGYLPIVTLQYAEDYTAYPSAQMVSDFKRLADAGALIINGSQAHTPKSMFFYNDSFLHYGLGNLFFDQMEVYYNDYLMQGTREAFIDKLVFYDGQLISIELLTTMLEDYARPRPMIPSEREALLARIFKLALNAYEE